MSCCNSCTHCGETGDPGAGGRRPGTLLTSIVERLRRREGRAAVPIARYDQMYEALRPAPPPRAVEVPRRCRRRRYQQRDGGAGLCPKGGTMSTPLAFSNTSASGHNTIPSSCLGVGGGMALMVVVNSCAHEGVPHHSRFGPLQYRDRSTRSGPFYEPCVLIGQVVRPSTVDDWTRTS